MKLVLAEKPSVAQSIAKVLEANERSDGYLEGNGYVVSWCVGHLVELFEPEGYDEKYSKWNYDDLPIVPEEWKYQVSAGTRKQFGVLRQLMKRDDVESLVCATDAGREGELIFRLVYNQCRCKKPFERLWISSMEDSAIREGFANLKPSTEYDALYEAALSRERADYGKPRSKDFHWKYFKQLLQENGLPDIRWHDLRATYCTILLKNDFNPKAVSKLMGHAKEIITIDVYGDKQEIIEDCLEALEPFIDEVLPEEEEEFNLSVMDYMDSVALELVI